MQAGSQVLVSESSHFSADDTNKPVYILEAGNNGAPLSTNIVSVLSPTMAVLAAPAASSVGNASVTVGFDDTTSIQNAITAVGRMGGGTVYIPAGFYRIAGTLEVGYSHIRLTGDGPNSILFESDLESYPDTQNTTGGWSPHRLIDVGVSQGIVADAEIDHLQVQSNGDTWIPHSIGQSLIETSPTGNQTVEDFDLHDVTFTSMNFGLFGNGGVLTGFSIHGNVMTEVAKEGIYLAGTPSNGVVSENQIATDIYPSVSNIAIVVKNAADIQIINNSITGAFNVCIEVGSVGGVWPENNISITNNSCAFADSPNIADGIAISQGTNISVVGNTITGYAAYGIRFAGSGQAISGIQIAGNTVQRGNGGGAIVIVPLPADPTNGPANVTITNNSLIENYSVGSILALTGVGGSITVTHNNITAAALRKEQAVFISTQPGSVPFCSGNVIVNYQLGNCPSH
jgi:polygalacturonase